jgi:hypothetical protein
LLEFRRVHDRRQLFGEHAVDFGDASGCGVSPSLRLGADGFPKDWDNE